MDMENPPPRPLFLDWPFFRRVSCTPAQGATAREGDCTVMVLVALLDIFPAFHEIYLYIRNPNITMHLEHNNAPTYRFSTIRTT